jgi:enamine deaminase RidA (YjgF/YER057c/UK114 family)
MAGFIFREFFAMPRFLNPSSVSQPASRYSQGVLTGPYVKRLVISGQVGARADGTVVEGLEAQTEQVFDNIFAMLKAADMQPSHLVKLTVFCTVAGGSAVVREIRNRRLGSHSPASTFLQVAGLANPAYLIEIEGEAINEA